MTEVDLQEIRNGLEAHFHDSVLTMLESMDGGKMITPRIGVVRYALLEQGLITDVRKSHELREITTLTPKGQEYLNKCKAAGDKVNVYTGIAPLMELSDKVSE